MRTRTQRTYARLIVIPAILMAIGIAGCGHPDEAAKPANPLKTVQAEVFTVLEANRAGEYEATGTLRSELNATLASKVMGRVVSVPVREGDSFRSGQLLVSLDARELQSGLNMAEANLHSSVVVEGTARTAVELERRTSQARIAQAESQVHQAEAALSSAQARRDLAVAGPRTQEVAQSHIAVVQAESNLKLANTELDRTKRLVQEGAVAQAELDLAQNRYDLAKSQLENARQSENIAHEGTRTQELQAAQDAVRQSQGALAQAKAAFNQARAAALQTEMKRKEVEVANAQVQQAAAASQSARVALSYAGVTAPFDGRVVQRMVDPGSMASPGSPLLAVEGGKYRLEVVVPERILSWITLGTTAPIQIDSLKTDGLSGKVVEIVPQASAVSHSFVVKLALDPISGMKSGIFGKAKIKVGESAKVLIPSRATWEKEGLHYVFAVNSEGIARLRIVTLGEMFADRVEVLSGLGTGDKIVVSDPTQVADGNLIEAK